MADKKDTRMARGMAITYLLLTLCVGGLLVGGLVSTIVVHGDEWRARGEKREAGVRTEPARRGNIYSSDGKILATTVTECDLYLDLMDTVVYEKGRPKLDSKGREVHSGPIVDSNFTRYLDSVCLILSDAMPQHSAQYYRERIARERAKSRPGRCFLVQRGVPYSVWLQICRVPGWSRGVVKNVNYKSVIHQERAHIYGSMAANTIGFRNEQKLGSYTGLEGYYDSILRGRDGRYNCRRLTKGIWLPDQPRGNTQMLVRTDEERIDTIVLQRKVDGQSIVSTIDTRYQDIAENALRKALLRYGGVSGCAVLMEMQTGYVLACSNLSIDTARHTYTEMRDRNVAVSHVIEPGSTFKTVALMAMLTDPEVTIDTAATFAAWVKDFGGKKGLVNDDHPVRDSASHTRRSLNVREIIQYSSNVGMADMGMTFYGDRRQRLRERMLEVFPYDMGGIDVKAPESRAYIVDDMRPNANFTRLCFGYATSVSPLQILAFYNAVGAGGRMVKPLFCRAIVDGDQLREVRPVVLSQSICTREQALLMRSLLEQVVEHGTGDNIKNTTYGIAGKTGTAYHSYANIHRYNASFAGFFPSENPRYSCYVLLEDVPSYGRQAAEVFKAISDCVVAIDMGLSENGVKSAWPTLEADSAAALTRPELLRGKQADIKELYKRLHLPYHATDSAGQWVVYRPATDSTAAAYDDYRPTGGRVPNCLGMTAKDAIELLRSEGYDVRLQGYGKVVAQSPRANAAAKKGTTVMITLK